MQVYVITINSTHIHTCMQINTNLHMFFNHLYDIIKQIEGKIHVSTLVVSPFNITTNDPCGVASANV